MTLDEYYKENIEVLNNLCDKYNWDRDYISDTYNKVRKNLMDLTGLTEQDYYRYIRRAIGNRMIDDKRSKENKYIHYRYDEHYSTETENNYHVKVQHAAEKKLAELDEWDREGKIYAWELEYLSRLLFKYIEYVAHYSEIEVFIFKTYAITGYTYKEIEEKFGLKQDRCKNTMRKFRKDLRANFINYVENYGTFK